jgi:alkylhydroperoxidase family enzyme
MARDAGVTPAEIEAVRVGTTESGWAPLDHDLLGAVDELVDGYVVSDDTWARLAAQLDERQLIELVFVVGTYTALAMAFNSFGLQLDADLQAAATTSGPEHEE